ncbi:MAG: aminotransferase class V-fold PLP-dependent enzyme [Ilumatobacteraceae bacterium]
MSVPTRSDFRLEPGLVFLNHGSFGAVPAAIEQAAADLRAEMERNPVEWLGRRSDELLAEARSRLAGFVGAPAEDVVFFPNPTTAVNMVVRSLRLQPGDEVLITDHEYGACVRTWRKWCDEHGVRLVVAPIVLPVADPAATADAIWSHVTDRTRVLFVSHLTSATALVLPAADLCRRARRAGILTIIDGAHVPAHLDLDLRVLEADVYTGALHKWLCAPKGASFLYASPAVQEWLEPLVVSWGWESDAPTGSRFVDHHQWQGTRDLTPFLAVSAALDFVEQHDWATVRADGHRRVVAARAAIDSITGLEPVCPPTRDWLGQMAVVRLPPDTDVAALQSDLYTSHRIEVPCHRWNGQPLMRISATAHTTDADIEALVAALPDALKGSRT